MNRLSLINSTVLIILLSTYSHAYSQNNSDEQDVEQVLSESSPSDEVTNIDDLESNVIDEDDATIDTINSDNVEVVNAETIVEEDTNENTSVKETTKAGSKSEMQEKMVGSKTETKKKMAESKSESKKKMAGSKSETKEVMKKAEAQNSVTANVQETESNDKIEPIKEEPVETTIVNDDVSEEIKEEMVEVQDFPPPYSGTLPDPNEFGGAPEVPGTSRLLATGEDPIEYIVKPGDNLFDICDQLLDEPNYWKKLWSLNSNIKNPHFIYPGRVLRFFPGDGKNPPYMEVVSDDDVIPIDSTPLANTELIEENVNPVNVPDEFQEFLNKLVGPEDIVVSSKIREMFDFVGGISDRDLITVQLPALIFSESPEIVGIHTGSTLGEPMSIRGEKGIFHSSDENIQPGELYTIMRKQDDARDRHGSFVGEFYTIVGHFKANRKLNDDGYYTGKITLNNNNAIFPGDIVTPYKSVKRRVKLKKMREEAGQDIDASVIGFGTPNGQLAGQGNIVIIDRGTGDNIQEGQVINIYSHYGRHQGTNLVHDFPDPESDGYRIGIFQVIYVTDDVSIGFILDSTDAIAIGDRTIRSAG